jgi:hypothetical protein
MLYPIIKEIKGIFCLFIYCQGDTTYRVKLQSVGGFIPHRLLVELIGLLYQKSGDDCSSVTSTRKAFAWCSLPQRGLACDLEHLGVVARFGLSLKVGGHPFRGTAR